MSNVKFGMNLGSSLNFLPFGCLICKIRSGSWPALCKGRGATADYSKLRYWHIVIMADSDPDGSHITSLALGYFLAYYPKLIEDGHVFIATPPFYRLNYPKNIHINILNETYFSIYKVAIALFGFE